MVMASLFQAFFLEAEKQHTLCIYVNSTQYSGANMHFLGVRGLRRVRNGQILGPDGPIVKPNE